VAVAVRQLEAAAAALPAEGAAGVALPAALSTLLDALPPGDAESLAGMTFFLPPACSSAYTTLCLRKCGHPCQLHRRIISRPLKLPDGMGSNIVGKRS
jgi:hypothetical protein